jgi:SAM-dependent methyltransferase
MLARSAKSLLNAVHGRAVFRRRVEVLAALLASAIPSGGRVLDIGSGDGRIARRLMDLRPDLEVEGVDVLVRPVTHIPVRPYDGTTLPFADESFDYVTLVDVLHHTDDPAAVLREARRVVRQGIVVKDHLRDGVLAGPTLRLMDWAGNRGHDVRLPYNYLDRTGWADAFDKAGLVVANRWERLALYPAPLDWVFGRNLHFLAYLAPEKPASG